MKIAYIDGPRLRRSLLAAFEYAQQKRAELNRINVFPVPDGDTGTNLAFTVRAISDRLRRIDDRDVSVVAGEAAQAAILGARGNCGMILSHFLLGFSERLEGRARVDSGEFAEALGAGVENLYVALERPVEGTILTVMRETAEAAEETEVTDFHALFSTLLAEARESLGRTPDLLPVLKKAGVVDAGAKGFVHILEGIVRYIHGDPIVELGEEELDDEPLAVAAADFQAESEQYRYCTEALVRGDGLPDVPEVKARFRDTADSIIVIRSGDILKLHLHTDDPDGVFEVLRSYGTLVTSKAEDMEAQHAAAQRAAADHTGLVRRPLTILTDSACDLPDEVLQAHGVEMVPLTLITGDKSFRDRVDISAAEFHERMRNQGELPTTSQPAPAEFLEGFEAAGQTGEEILAVLLSSSLSGTFASAEAATGHYDGGRVHLMDSLAISILQGLLVLKACELAEKAMPAAEIVSELERIRRGSGLLFTVDTFDRLLASGRVSRGKAWLGSLLNVKPILGVTPRGKVVPMGKAIGRQRVLPTLMEALAERIPADVKKLRFGVVHIACPEILEPVTAALREAYGDVDVMTGPATPVISTHLGVGAWGVAYMVED